jgi:FKBP-type peptidyl-prolyl cis-trans isomerase
MIFTGAAQKTKKMTEQDSLAYALGITVGVDVKQQFPDINVELFTRGITDFLKDVKNMPIKNHEEAMEFLHRYFTKMQEQTATTNREAGEKFLANNAKKSGVTTTASGLQYSIITVGSGARPTATDRVKVHYRGTLIDGTEFDSSFARNEPIVFALNQVIPGWTEALQLMTVGSKWRIFLPYDLAYGERGAGGDIGPFSTLIFEVELLDIEK